MIGGLKMAVRHHTLYLMLLHRVTSYLTAVAYLPHVFVRLEDHYVEFGREQAE